MLCDLDFGSSMNVFRMPISYSYVVVWPAIYISTNLYLPLKVTHNVYKPSPRLTAVVLLMLCMRLPEPQTQFARYKYVIECQTTKDELQVSTLRTQTVRGHRTKNQIRYRGEHMVRERRVKM